MEVVEFLARRLSITPQTDDEKDLSNDKLDEDINTSSNRSPKDSLSTDNIHRSQRSSFSAEDSRRSSRGSLNAEEARRSQRNSMNTDKAQDSLSPDNATGNVQRRKSIGLEVFDFFTRRLSNTPTEPDDETKSNNDQEVHATIGESSGERRSSRGTLSIDDAHKSPRGSISADARRSSRGSISADARRSSRGSISAEDTHRSPRGSISVDEAHKSPRGSTSVEYARKSPRGSISADARRSPRGSISAEDTHKSPRGSIYVEEARKSPRGSISIEEARKSPRGSISVNDARRSPRGSISVEEARRSSKGSISLEETYNSPYNNVPEIRYPSSNDEDDQQTYESPTKAEQEIKVENDGRRQSIGMEVLGFLTRRFSSDQTQEGENDRGSNKTPDSEYEDAPSDTEEGYKSSRESISVARRSPRGSMTAEMDHRSPRGSITVEEARRSSRGSISAETRGSSRGSTSAEQDRRSSRGSISVDEVHRSPRGSISAEARRSSRGSTSAETRRYSRGSISIDEAYNSPKNVPEIRYPSSEDEEEQELPGSPKVTDSEVTASNDTRRKSFGMGVVEYLTRRFSGVEPADIDALSNNIPSHIPSQEVYSSPRVSTPEEIPSPTMEIEQDNLTTNEIIQFDQRRKSTSMEILDFMVRRFSSEPIPDHQSKKNNDTYEDTLESQETHEYSTRSPRGSIPKEPPLNHQRSPRGSLSAQETRRSPRGSMSIEDPSRSPRGSISVEEGRKSPRGLTPVGDGHKSPRRSVSDEGRRSARGSISAEGNRRSQRGSKYLEESTSDSETESNKMTYGEYTPSTENFELSSDVVLERYVRRSVSEETPEITDLGTDSDTGSELSFNWTLNEIDSDHQSSVTIIENQMSYLKQSPQKETIVMKKTKEQDSEVPDLYEALYGHIITILTLPELGGKEYEVCATFVPDITLESSITDAEWEEWSQMNKNIAGDWTTTMPELSRLDTTGGWTTIDTLWENKKKKPLDSITAVTFCGCGFLGGYLVGAATYLQERAPHLLRGRIAGSSVGSLIAACIVCDVPLELVRKNLLNAAQVSQNYFMGPFNPFFPIEEPLLKNLLTMIPEDGHIRASGRLFLSLTRATTLTNEIVSEYSSRAELIRALLCCCFLPFISGFTVPTFQGRRYLDGGMSNNMPLKGPRTLTINAFSGTFDICPQDPEGNDLPLVNSQNQSIKMSTANLVKLVQALLPPKPEELDKNFYIGYNDAQKYFPQEMSEMRNL